MATQTIYSRYVNMQKLISLLKTLFQAGTYEVEVEITSTREMVSRLDLTSHRSQTAAPNQQSPCISQESLPM